MACRSVARSWMCTCHLTRHPPLRRLAALPSNAPPWVFCPPSFETLDVWQWGGQRGFAFITFASAEGCASALEWHETEYMGRTLRVQAPHSAHMFIHMCLSTESEAHLSVCNCVHRCPGALMLTQRLGAFRSPLIARQSARRSARLLQVC